MTDETDVTVPLPATPETVTAHQPALTIEVKQGRPTTRTTESGILRQTRSFSKLNRYLSSTLQRSLLWIMTPEINNGFLDWLQISLLCRYFGLECRCGSIEAYAYESWC